MNHQGFVDLRMNQSDHGEESFWPSFTDIMMVIVMIFLLAMVILITRNMELVNQLRSSLKAEQTATLQAQSTSNQNSVLNERLQQLEKDAAMMRMKLMDLSDEQSQTQHRLTESQTRNSALRDQYAQLLQSQAILVQNNRALEQQREESNSLLMQEKESRLALQKQYQSAQQALLTLQSTHQNSVNRMTNLEKEYAGLEKKYQRLIRPARSSKGKYVVQVKYRKDQGHLMIALKEPSDRAFIAATGTEMHKRLSAIQKKHAKDMYVKIIFPEDSGLSYTEAWKMTESLLRMYDYYYQEDQR